MVLVACHVSLTLGFPFSNHHTLLSLLIIICFRVMSSAVFEVDRILEKRLNETFGYEEYLIRWKGFTSDDDSWEPRNCLIDCDEALAEFEARCRVRQQRCKSSSQRKKSPEKKMKRANADAGSLGARKKRKMLRSADEADYVALTQMTQPQQRQHIDSQFDYETIDCSLEDNAKYFRIRNLQTGDIIKTTLKDARDDPLISLILIKFFEKQIEQTVPTFEFKLNTGSCPKSQPLIVSECGDETQEQLTIKAGFLD